MSEPDRIERLVGQWAVQRPDLDVETMDLVARLLRAARLINAGIGDLASEFGLHPSEGDVLFTLRRAGSPFRLTPTQLAASMLVTSGTMTNRLDRLEERGLIKRLPNPTDRRSLDVELTDEGRRIADTAITQHVANERTMLSVLSKRDRADLVRITRKLIEHLEQT